jgi:hypothetical protein
LFPDIAFKPFLSWLAEDVSLRFAATTAVNFSAKAR